MKSSGRPHAKLISQNIQMDASLRGLVVESPPVHLGKLQASYHSRSSQQRDTPQPRTVFCTQRTHNNFCLVEPLKHLLSQIMKTSCAGYRHDLKLS